MSLRVDLTKIPNYETVCWEGPKESQSGGFLVRGAHEREDGIYEWPMDLCAIVNMMLNGTQYHEITEKNLDDLAAQLDAFQRVGGPWLRDANGNPVYIGKSDLQKYMGLHTNTYSNRTAWKKTIMGLLTDRAANNPMTNHNATV